MSLQEFCTFAVVSGIAGACMTTTPNTPEELTLGADEAFASARLGRVLVVDILDEQWV